MRTKTILKTIEDVLQLWLGDKKQKQKAVEKLVELRNRLVLKVQEEEKKQLSSNPTAYNLFRWYYGLWNGKIPEGNAGRAVKVFQQLLEEFQLSDEEIKETYEWWKNLDKEKVSKNLQKQYSIVLTAEETRSITDFKGKLRFVKALKKEIESFSGKKWTSPENERGIDYYLQAIEKKEEDDDVPL